MSQTASGRLAGKRAVVTGAAMGLGQASAIAMAQEGADLVLMDREDLADTAKAVRALGRSAETHLLDLTAEAEIVAAFDAVKAAGAIDILLNNVGGSARERAREFWESSSEVWRHVINLSLMPTLYCSRQVVGEMRERASGKIVNIASDAPLVGDARHADYSAAKGGVIGFTRSLARELAPFGVSINAICPGPILTRAVEQLPRDMMEKVAASIPMKRYARPQEIARSVVFLASSDSDYITGISLVVDGGRWMV
jgi:acetoacetyl-CoA reductase/3-oxoacyl-[acyl-carrier protein] reductase